MKTLPKRQRPYSNRAAGFTLVEITIALGICTTVMVALLGLLPLSIDQFRDARNLTTMARISEDIINDVQLIEWPDLERLDGERREYDDQGTRIEDVSLDRWRHVYSAEIEVEKEGVTIPGKPDKTIFARRINIYIGTTKGQNVNLKARALTDKRVKKFSTVIANLNELKVIS